MLAMIGGMWAAYALWSKAVVHLFRRARRRSEWSLECTPAQLAHLRTQPAFLDLLALARLANQIRFLQAAIPPRDDDSPSARRQLMNAYLFAAPLLRLGVPVAQRMIQRYRYRLPAADGFAQLLSAKDVREFLATHVQPLTPEIVLSVDQAQLAARLAALPQESTIFASGAKYGVAQLYYDLPDLAAVHSMTAPAETYEALVNSAERASWRTMSLALGFLRAADRLIAEVLAHEQLLDGGLPVLGAAP